MDPKELSQAFVAFKVAQEQANEAVKSLAKEIEKGSKEGIASAAAKADALAVQVQSLADRLVEAEQKLVKSVLAGTQAEKSLGCLVTTSNEFKAFASGSASRFRMETSRQFRPQANTITGQTASPSTNSDILVDQQRLAGIVPGAFRSLRVRDVLPSGPTTSNMIEFTRELAFTNNAAEAKEGAARAESALTFELGSAPVVSIGHWIKVTKQVLADSPALAAYIDNRLRYGVELRVDNQLVAGDGVGQNMKGMTHSDNCDVYSPVTGTALDNINRAKYLIAASDYQPTAIIMNPATWGAIERIKDAVTGRYTVGDPLGAITPILWGIPVVVTNAMTADKLLIGAMNIAFQVWEREGVAVEMTNANDTDFTKGLITVRAEERLALAGYRPASVLYGNLTI
jgi:HK97 family phage major capsid protein